MFNNKIQVTISSDVSAGIFKAESGKFKPFSGLILLLSVGELICNSIYSSLEDELTMAPILP